MVHIENTLNAQIGASTLKNGSIQNFPPSVEVVRLSNETSVADAINYYESNPAVEYAEPDYILHSFETSASTISPITPNDTYWSNLYGMQIIKAPYAWSISTGSSSVIVAVVDTGVDYTHPDLTTNIWTDSSGYHGYDYVNDDNYPLDDNGHGTHCAGTIGAVGNNGVGVAGVVWNTQIMALKFLDSSGSRYTSDAVSAIQYAKKNGASIISCSWGGYTYSQTLNDTINSSGALVVCAAGNGGPDNKGDDNDVIPQYPSSYTCDNIIAVAATDSSDTLASFSNYGLTSVDVAAPGVSILSTRPGSSYQSMSGTSMATPHVSGLAALLKAVDSSLNSTQLKQKIFSGVDTVPGLSGKCVTGGRINALNSTLASIPLSAKFYGVPGTIVNPLTINFYDASGGYPDAWSWNFGDGNTSTEQNPNHTYNNAGTYIASLTVQR